MKVNPQLTPYRPAPPQYLPPKSQTTGTETATKTMKADTVNETRLSAEEKLRRVIEEKQSIIYDPGVDGIQRAPDLGKLLDLRA